MIKGNTVYYGYGDIYNDCSGFDTLIFMNFEPSQKVGTNVDIRHVKIINRISVSLSLNELYDLENKLKSIKMSEIINIKNINLDFSNFNQKSVNIVLSTVKCLIMNTISLMAC